MNPRKLSLTTKRPGQTAHSSGQWEMCYPDGTPYPAGGEATVTKGEPLPPTSAPGLLWRLTDRSRRRGEAADDAPESPETGSQDEADDAPP